MLLNDPKYRPVLDKGHVRLIDHLGDDRSVVNAARVSFEKETEEMTPSDVKLINFLLREGHTSPFRHAYVSLSFRAPLMVARQHYKYIVASSHHEPGDVPAWNEASRRYITEAEEFYIPKPNQWRSAPENKKQGSGEAVDLAVGSMAFQTLMEDVDRQMAHYKWALDSGICAEQARLFLPAYGLYVSYRWSTSLAALLHFLSERLEHDAQLEIQEYAKAVYSLVEPLFPVCFSAFGF